MGVAGKRWSCGMRAVRMPRQTACFCYPALSCHSSVLAKKSAPGCACRSTDTLLADASFVFVYQNEYC